MDTNNQQNQNKIDKFLKIKTKKGIPMLNMGGGIFTSKTRKKLLGLIKQPKPGMSTNQFWYKIRNQVERAIIDLRIFVEFSGIDNVNQVITRENLEPLLYGLLWIQLFNEGPDKNQAEIAQLLIEHGLMYLEGMFHSESSLPLSSKRTIEEAVDLSKYLVSRVEELRKADRERREYISQAKLIKKQTKS